VVRDDVAQQERAHESVLMKAPFSPPTFTGGHARPLMLPATLFQLFMFA